MLLLELCRGAPVEHTSHPHRRHSDVTGIYSRGMTTVTSSGAGDVMYDAVDDEDSRRVQDDDLEHSGSGDVPSRDLDRRPHRGTRPWIGRPTSMLLNIQRFRQASDDVATTTRRTAAASSSTSWQSMTSLVTSSLLPRLVLIVLRI